MADLATLTSVCKQLHAAALPFVYHHTVLTMQSPICQKNQEERVQPCLSVIRGLAMNTQGQCRFAQKLTLRTDGHLGGPGRATAVGELTAHLAASHGSDYNASIAAMNPFRFLVNSLLELAINQMDRLTNLE